MKRKAIFLSIGIITALVTLISGCGGNKIGENLDTAGVSTGRLIVSITDDPGAEGIDKVWVTISGLQVHMAGNEDTETDNGGWEELELVGANQEGKVRFDLLALQDGLQKDLTVAELGIGKYTQIRMAVELVELDFLGSDDDNALIKATLPSGKLKFIQPFELLAGQTTELLFDFDVLKSLNETGNGKWICKPVIKLDVVSQPIAEALVITTASLPNGEVGVSYAPPPLTASVAVGNLTWSLDTGSVLPGGLTLNSSGQISGIPILSGAYTFTVKVTDDGTFPKNTATKSFTINISLLNITTTSLPAGTKDVPYAAFNLVAVGGNGVYTWSPSSPVGIPNGLTISASGVVSGTPTADGDYSFTAQVTDTSNPVQTDTQVITIHINAPPAP